MAFEIVDAVFDLPLADPHAKLVLLALARHADKQGRCYPSAKRLAELTGITDRTIYRKLNTLEGLGLIKRKGRMKDGRKTSNVYTLILTQRPNNKSVYNNISNLSDSMRQCVSMEDDPFMKMAQDVLKGENDGKE
jgi:DNA-binding transcriptional ArsR family regulator